MFFFLKYKYEKNQQTTKIMNNFAARKEIIALVQGEQNIEMLKQKINQGYTNLTFCMLCNFSCTDFSKLCFLNESFWITIRVSNGLDPDRERHSIGPDLDPNCLQRLSADDKRRRS